MWMVLAACDIGTATEEVTSGVIGTTVEVSKSVVEGVKSGVTEGREGADTSGAKVLLDEQSIRDTLDFEMVSVVATPEGIDLTLALRNDTEQAAIVKGLDQIELLAIDGGGFATRGAFQDRKIEVPAQAKVKVVAKFGPTEGTIQKIRVVGEEFAVTP
jgi:hypothetical protein